MSSSTLASLLLFKLRDAIVDGERLWQSGGRVANQLGVRPNDPEGWAEGTPRGVRASGRGVEGASVPGGVATIVAVSDCASGIGTDVNTCR
jgi:hypothetical protein